MSKINSDGSSASTKRLSIRGDATYRRGCSNKYAPKCNCQLYATIYKSRTVENPDRLFLGCPNFRENLSYCKFFKWLDEAAGDDEVTESEKHGWEQRLINLEERILELEKQESPKIVISRFRDAWFFLIGFVFAVVMSVLCSRTR